MLKIWMLGACLATLSACSVTVGNDNQDDGNGATNTSGSVGSSAIDWSRVPASMNPQVIEMPLSLVGVQRVALEPVLLREPSVIVKSNPNLSQDQAIVRTYYLGRGSTYLVSATLDSFGFRWRQSTQGMTSCQIRITNRLVTSVNGICQIRLEVDLPPSAKVEVYQDNVLIGPRFFALKYSEFFDLFDKAVADRERLSATEQFVESYRATGTTLQLNASVQLRALLRKMSFRDGRLALVSLLHSFVQDRAELRDVLDRELRGSERQSAQSITGV